MKSLICSIILLCSVIAMTIFVGSYTDRQLKHFADLIDAKIPNENTSAAYRGAEEMEQEYENIKVYLIIFMNESEIRDIEMHISDIKSAAKADDLQNLIAAKSRLKLHIKQLRRLSTFSIEAIF